jgi:hypothetical protein
LFLPREVQTTPQPVRTTVITLPVDTKMNLIQPIKYNLLGKEQRVQYSPAEVGDLANKDYFDFSKYSIT